ncbi:MULTISPECIES: serine/threonine-protein kinase [Pseudomonas]|uniref:serine/threonine-protein kinase n=1 Tax=Pseudomonas TaxID=286 RepID=UPI000421BB89|nr:MULTISPECIES: serine/threonine-protein kinase [Pseudomonas]USX37509.1 serine/threonine protein kinase [Pseudomonas putida]HDS1818183.1 serine/threonine protein kinase [Pseudomonas putida]
MIIPYQTAQVSFKKQQRIGENGENSEVYVVHDEHLDAELVIKQVKTDGFNEERYLLEAQLLYKSVHPYVVQVLYACKDAQHIFIAMPYYRRGSLHQVVEAEGLTCRQLIRYSIQFLSGLNNIHSKGLLHFDIKPDNILISDTDEALLSDFGFSKNMDDDGFATPELSYRLHLPPEGSVTSDFNNSADIYQVGLTLYRLLAGLDSLQRQRDSFKLGAELARAQRTETYPDLKQLPLHVPKKLKSIIKKCLRYDPDSRYQSVMDLLNDLSSIEDVGLDWRFSTDGGVRRWESISSDGTGLLVEVADNGQCVASKKTSGGTYRKKPKLCEENVTSERIHEILMSSEW